MKRTLESDAPILVGDWTAAVLLAKREPVRCGCLMMDGHVQEFLAKHVYHSAAAAYFLAELYSVRVDTIRSLADEFDRFAKVRIRSDRVRKLNGSWVKILNDEARTELLNIINARLAA